MIFALQLLLIVLIPVLDDGGRLMPMSYAAAALAVSMLTVLILCGAASFVLIGLVFASIHAIVGLGDGIGYTLVGGVEHARPLRWVDFVWLSFSTLTTAGFGDVTPVNAAACAVSTLESLCGILFPATLIARIASLPAAPRENGG